MDFFPELLKFQNGNYVKSTDDFKLRRAEMLDILAKNEYGYLPPVTGKTTFEIVETDEKNCAGHGPIQKLNIFIDTPKGKYTLPADFITPAKKEKFPVFMFINFNKSCFNRYFPMEEIIDRGYGVCYVYYENITSDDGDMQNGLAGMFDRPEDGTGYGKISIWAFAMSRVLDCVLELPGVDKENIAVVGHSRLGKTALWCGANDERIKYVISNCSGCSGAAYERIKHGKSETFRAIYNVFPYWFCENFEKWVDNPENCPFDQHFLLACCAPRCVFIGSQDEDEWADYYSEQLCCKGASPAFELFGVTGYNGKTEPAEPGYFAKGGHISYHLGGGRHYLGRYNWNRYLDAIETVIPLSSQK